MKKKSVLGNYSELQYGKSYQPEKSSRSEAIHSKKLKVEDKSKRSTFTSSYHGRTKVLRGRTTEK